MAKRQCHGVTKAGKACQAAPLRDSEFCSAHDPDSPVSTRFGSREQATAAGVQGGRPRQPRAVDVLRERLEDDVDRVLTPLFDALEADRGVVVGSGEYAELEKIPDWQARLAAARELLDRAYGKAAQTMRHEGSDGGPMELRVATPEVAKAAHEFLDHVRRERENAK